MKETGLRYRNGHYSGSSICQSWSLFQRLNQKLSERVRLKPSSGKDTLTTSSPFEMQEGRQKIKSLYIRSQQAGISSRLRFPKVKQLSYTPQSETLSMICARISIQQRHSIDALLFPSPSSTFASENQFFKENLEESITNFSSHLRVRGYPNTPVNDIVAQIYW